MLWSQERSDLVKKLWLEGKTAGDIVKIYGGTLNRNQVLGHLYRAGLLGKRPTKPHPIPRHTLQHRIQTRRKAAERAAASIMVPVGPPPSNASLRSFNAISGPCYNVADLGYGDCRWPIGDPQSQFFCYCAAPTDKRPYCFFHRAIAYERYARPTPSNVRQPGEANRLGGQKKA